MLNKTPSYPKLISGTLIFIFLLLAVPFCFVGNGSAPCNLAIASDNQVAVKSKRQILMQLVACASNIKNIKTAVKMYKTDNKRYPPSLRVLVGKYLRKIPTCHAAGGKDTYSQSYRVYGGGKHFIIYCGGDYHKDAGLPPNYPRYDSRNGKVEYKPGVTDLRNLSF
ncbi:MAG: hypothetical protein K8T10_06665 [Candidatus Eremiobacteraeota bacterium]|nr:hypothetical protein [Candidatus Eremiobacteraeota bacterium]